MTTSQIRNAEFGMRNFFALRLAIVQILNTEFGTSEIRNVECSLPRHLGEFFAPLLTKVMVKNGVFRAALTQIFLEYQAEAKFPRGVGALRIRIRTPYFQ